LLSTETVGSGGWLVADAGGAFAGVLVVAASAGAFAGGEGATVVGGASIFVPAGSAGCAAKCTGSLRHMSAVTLTSPIVFRRGSFLQGPRDIVTLRLERLNTGIPVAIFGTGKLCQTI
jgi:hypothetical protein